MSCSKCGRSRVSRLRVGSGKLIPPALARFAAEQGHARTPKMPRVQPHILGQNVVYMSTVRAGIPRPHHIISLTLLHCGGYEGCHHHCPLSFGGGGNGGGGEVMGRRCQCQVHCGGYERCHRHRPQSLGGGGEGGNGGEEEVVVMREGGGGSNVMAMKDARPCFAACFLGGQGI